MISVTRSMKTNRIFRISMLFAFSAALFVSEKVSAKEPQSKEPRPKKVPYAGVLSLNPKIDHVKSLAPTHTGVWSSPTAEGLIIGSYDEDWVGAYSLKKGKYVWWHSTDKSSLSTQPTVYDNKVILSFRSGKITQLDNQTGAKTWGINIPTYVDRPMVVIDDLLILQTVDQKVFALDYVSGKTKWLFESPVKPSLGLSGGAKPLSIGDYLLVGDDSGYLYSLKKTDGVPVWRFNPQTTDNRFQSVVGGLAYYGQNLIAARSDGFVGAFVPEGGEATQRLWQLKNFDQVSRALSYEESYYVASLDGSIASVDVTSGSTAWNKKLAHPVSYLHRTAKNLYALSTKCQLTSLDPTNGDEKWSVDLNGFCHGNLFDSDNKLYLATGYNRFYLFEDL